MKIRSNPRGFHPRTIRFALLLAASPLLAQAASDPPARVPATGQSVCFSGNQTTPCAGTGQDGEFQAGLPLPQPRFLDNGDGTVLDQLTGLVWTRAANCFGRRTWGVALDMVVSLADGSCGLTDGSSPGDWRLPNTRELNSLIHHDFAGPAVSDAAGTSIWVEGGPFTDVRSAFYWSSTSAAVGTFQKFASNLATGEVRLQGNVETNRQFVWAVRDGG